MSTAADAGGVKLTAGNVGLGDGVVSSTTPSAGAISCVCYEQRRNETHGE